MAKIERSGISPASTRSVLRVGLNSNPNSRVQSIIAVSWVGRIPTRQSWHSFNCLAYLQQSVAPLILLVLGHQYADGRGNIARDENGD